MRLKKEPIKFRQIEAVFKVKIETEEELTDLIAFVKDPTKSEILIDKQGKPKLNAAGRLLLDFALGVIKNR